MYFDLLEEEKKNQTGAPASSLILWWFPPQVLNVLSECIEKEGYSYVVEDDLRGDQERERAHSGPRRR